MEQFFKKGAVFHLPPLVEYSEGGIINKQLIKSSAGNITLFSFDKGEGLSEHHAPFDALVQILEGDTNTVVNGQEFTVKTGENIVFSTNTPYAPTAIERFRMLLVIIKEQHLETGQLCTNLSYEYFGYFHIKSFFARRACLFIFQKAPKASKKVGRG